jgi:hypothetical protein
MPTHTLNAPRMTELPVRNTTIGQQEGAGERLYLDIPKPGSSMSVIQDLA